MTVTIYCDDCDQELVANVTTANVAQLIEEHELECPENEDNEEDGD